MTLTLNVVLLAALLCILLSTVREATAENDSSTVEEPRATELKRIYSLDDHCIENKCSNYHYENTSQVAFFDLKAQVHIRDQSTYDVNNPIEYEALVFENSTFAHFPLHLFYSLGLSELDIRNCSVEVMTWENFLMAGKLKILLLSDNKLQTIEEMTFNFATELQYLFLERNRLRTLVSESFKGLTALRYLDLSGNRLKELPVGMFDYLTSLQELKLAQNRLRVIGNDVFSANPLLLTVSLNGNRLRDLGEYAFKSQTDMLLLDISHNERLESLVMNLQVRNLIAANCSLYRVNIYGDVVNVDMRDNRIMELYFSQPETLETLNLRNNSLEQIASLARVTNLRSLDLADNPDIKTLPDPWSVQSLERLDLSNTGIYTMPISSLAEQSNLHYLNVSHNKLSDISPSNFKYLEKLTHFYIHANNWNCYNLNSLMEILIKPRGMTYTRDVFDPEFPGEYIGGIACMYRLEQDEYEVFTTTTTKDNYIALSDGEQSEDPSLEIGKLRRELKAIVMFYESKFDKTFAMINDLKARVAIFERMNDTFWQHVTITT